MADWQTVAHKAYEAAMNLGPQHGRGAISRAYYAAYSRAAALLRNQGVSMPQGREGPSHSHLPMLVETHLRNLRDRRWPMAGLIRRLYAMRVMADYQPSVAIQETDARHALSAMLRLFQLTKEKR